ncbi:MAG: alpha/beta hydrolase [Methylobacteriaceae bacterium]|nr:alpha/beta hydrolase [Methylobacteriaceae bacterium]
MASWQAHGIDAGLRLFVKRRLPQDVDVVKVRARIEKMAGRPPKGVRISQARVGCLGEWVEVPGISADAPVMLYLHGGGYVVCSPRTHRPITGFFAHAGFRVFCPDYRMAPENPFPTAVDDALSAYEGLLSRGVQPDDIVVAGDSAGGGLTMALLIALRDRNRPMPAAAALLSPWTDLALTGKSIRKNARRDAYLNEEGAAKSAELYLRGKDPRMPLASPLYDDLHNMPPVIIHVGGREILRDDSTRLAERIRAAGSEIVISIWPVVPHVWQIFNRILPEGRQSLAQIADFLHKHVRTRAA